MGFIGFNSNATAMNSIVLPFITLGFLAGLAQPVSERALPIFTDESPLHAATVDLELHVATAGMPLHVATAEWGQIGHYTTGRVAKEYLDPAAWARIQEILDGDSFEEATVYMDDVRSDDAYDSYADWHWVTIPDGMTYDQTEKNPNGDILAGIRQLTAELKAGGLTPELEREKLKFLMHLIGDIHMPLHVGTGEDMGGNQVRVTWFRETSNLHRVWDSDMINSRQMSYSELAEALGSVDASTIAQWQAATPEDWAMESMSYRDQVYDIPEDNRLGYEYRYKNFDLVRLRLLQAGIRMAGVLNEIYAR